MCSTEYNPDDDSQLDPGVLPYVKTLRSVGIETFESCQGGPGHSYAEPTVRFHGDRSEGYRALAVALQHGLPVYALRRMWSVIEGEPTGPWWELTFSTVVCDPREKIQATTIDSYRDIAVELAEALNVAKTTLDFLPRESSPHIDIALAMIAPALAKAADLGIPPKEDPNKGTPL